MSSTVQIKFTTSGWSAAFGSFGQGDLLRCSAAAAHHFVEEAKCAQYTEPPAEPPAQAAAPAVAEAAPAAAPRASRKATAQPAGVQAELPGSAA